MGTEGGGRGQDPQPGRTLHGAGAAVGTLLEMGRGFFGVFWWHLQCSLGALSSSSPTFVSIPWGSSCTVGLRTPAQGFGAHSPPSRSPARAVLPPPWLSHQQTQNLLCDQLHRAPGEGEDGGPGQLLGPGESGLQHDEELQGRLALCRGELGCLQGKGQRATPQRAEGHPQYAPMGPGVGVELRTRWQS